MQPNPYGNISSGTALSAQPPSDTGSGSAALTVAATATQYPATPVYGRTYAASAYNCNGYNCNPYSCNQQCQTYTGGSCGGGGCFPGRSRVLLENGTWVRMDALPTGARVLTANPETGRAEFSTVFQWLHYEPGPQKKRSMPYVSIATQPEGDGASHTITLSRNHFLVSSPCGGFVLLVAGAPASQVRDAPLTSHARR